MPAYARLMPAYAGITLAYARLLLGPIMLGSLAYARLMLGSCQACLCKAYATLLLACLSEAYASHAYAKLTPGQLMLRLGKHRLC